MTWNSWPATSGHRKTNWCSQGLVEENDTGCDLLLSAGDVSGNLIKVQGIEVQCCVFPGSRVESGAVAPR
jgi:hypothetical protein